jgi:uncharacterized membrane protein YkvI
MKNRNLIYTALVSFMMIFLVGCSLIGDIFQAGMWVGIVIVVAIVLLLIFIVSKFRRKS